MNGGLSHTKKQKKFVLRLFSEESIQFMLLYHFSDEKIPKKVFLRTKKVSNKICIKKKIKETYKSCQLNRLKRCILFLA